MRNAYFQLQDLWSPDEEYKKHRIPGMIVTKEGTLLIYHEARREPGDWSSMDILMQRSTDGGEHFEEPIYLAYGTEEHPTVNNPVMMQDQNGRIHFLHCTDCGVNGGKILRRYSDDDGKTWSEPIDITAYTLPDFRNAWALGPGHGICMPDGCLIVPVWMVPKSYASDMRDHFPSVVTTFYSKDNGETWQTGEILGINEQIISPNETTIALLSNGKVYLNIRHEARHRAVAISPNGYSDFECYQPDKRLIDPKCFGSAAYLPKTELHPHTVLFTNCECKTKRKNVVVKFSTDDTETWQESRVIDADRGGYTEIAVDNSCDRIYVLYESFGGEQLHLATFNYEWLVNGNA